MWSTGGSNETVFNLLSLVAFKGPRGDVDVNEGPILEGEYLAAGCIGGLITMLLLLFVDIPAAWLFGPLLTLKVFCMRRRGTGFVSDGMGAWLIIGVDWLKKVSWYMWIESGISARGGEAIAAVFPRTGLDWL